MRHPKKIILSLVAAAGLGLGMLLYHRDHTPQVLQESASQSAQQEQNSNVVTNQRVISNVAPRQEHNGLAPRTYQQYFLRGTVYEHQTPLKDSKVTALSEDKEESTTTTDKNGNFVIALDECSPHTITVRHNNRVRSLERVIPEQPVHIVFENSPNITLRMKNGGIQKAFLSDKYKATLEAMIIDHNEVVFPDVQPNQLYRAWITTNNAVIRDEIPVFDEDVIRDYQAPNITIAYGQVQDKLTKKGIPHAHITFTLPKTPREMFSLTATTNERGFFAKELAQVPYTVEIRAKGYRRTTGEEVQPKENDKITLELLRGAALTGKVIDEKEEPVANAKVYLVNPLGMHVQQDVDPVTTDDQGNFGLESINPETPPPFFPQSQSYIPLAVKQSYHQPALETMLFEKQNDDVYQEERNVILKVAKNRCTLEGRVFDAAYNPIDAKVRVRLVGMQGKSLPHGPWDWEKTLATEEGTFKLTQLPPGTYQVTVIPQKAESVYFITKKSIELPQQDATDIRLIQGILVQGKTSYEKNGMPIPNAAIVFTTENQQRVATRADEQGNFKVCLPPGNTNYFTWAERQDGLVEEETGTLAVGMNNYLPIFFKHQAYLTINVRDQQTGNPIQHYQVGYHEIIDKASYWRMRNGFDKLGRTQIPMAGPIKLTIEADGYKSSSIYKIKEVKDQEIEIKIKKK